MKNIQFIILIGLSVGLMSWHPYEPKMTLKEKELRGKVALVVENVSHWGHRCIVYQKYNKKGNLDEIRYYIPRQIMIDDSVFGKIPESVNENYRGLDTNMFRLGYRFVYSYNQNGKLINSKGITPGDTVFWEHSFQYDSYDSLVKIVYRYYHDGILNDSTVEKKHYEHGHGFLIMTAFHNNPDSAYSSIRLFDRDGRVKSIFYIEGFNNRREIKGETYEYKRKGNIIRREYYKTDLNCKNEIIIRISYEKWRRNLLRREKTINYCDYYEPMNGIEETTKYIHRRGLLKEMIVKKVKNDSTLEHYEVCYDKYRNYVKAIDISLSGIEVWRYTYVYDQQGNWIRSGMQGDGKSEPDMERIITYYSE